MKRPLGFTLIEVLVALAIVAVALSAGMRALAQGAALASAIPRAELWRTQGLGHSGALRDSATIARVVEFLRAK